MRDRWSRAAPMRSCWRAMGATPSSTGCSSPTEARMQQRLFKLWYEEPPGISVFQPLSWLYGAAVSTRRRAYERGWVRSYGVGRPVIVVGNLTVGGTGKTPLTIWLANHLRQRGFEVGLVSRGYGRDQGGLRAVTADSAWREVG